MQADQPDQDSDTFAIDWEFDLIALFRRISDVTTRARLRQLICQAVVDEEAERDALQKLAC